MNIEEKCIESYERHKRLQSVGQELNIPWQTVYVYLKKHGIRVVGDKLRYGSETDRLAASGELLFQTLVPEAENLNKNQFQSKIDFTINGYNIDVKTSTVKNNRYCFSLKKQERIADFFVMFGYQENTPAHTFLIPKEIMKNYQTISASLSRTNGKWWGYIVDKNTLRDFFMSLPRKPS